MVERDRKRGKGRTTPSGVVVRSTTKRRPYHRAIEPLIEALDTRRGVLLASSFEYPGRYTRWDIGFVDPPLEITARDRAFSIRALNARGEVLIGPLADAVGALPEVTGIEAGPDRMAGRLQPPARYLREESRTRMPSVFTVLRAVTGALSVAGEPRLGLYGAFGYDLVFQFEPMALTLPRAADQRDLVLYLPDEVLVVDHRREVATTVAYEFEARGRSTAGIARTGEALATAPAAPAAGAACDHAPGAFADAVREARAAFHRGDMFEAVLSQTFSEPCPAPPSEIFRRLRARNPAPYGALMSLGEGEHLVAASPEMFVRVDGRRIETCPISGTIARGVDAVQDAERISELLNSPKEAAELTMCTDVDRNDKSRVCVPGSVKVIGRRQIEMYSRLIHTVDHVEGVLAEGYDALDGFLAHAWAVTVTGAPKREAISFVEAHERSARLWYGGAIGFIGFDGSMNTGLTLRTVRIKDGIAEVRAGATLLYDSDPESEERETRLKASALIDAIRRPEAAAAPKPAPAAGATPGRGRRILMVDHEDSFVHTLASYLRETGAEVVTLRAGFPLEAMDEIAPDLVVLSPGPGRPADFDVSATIAAALARAIPVFGVCLGLQGIVEHFGGALETLDEPMHGKPSTIRVLGGRLLAGLPATFTAGRYHSLIADRARMPAELAVTAETETGVVMAVEHRTLPVAAVQFHPESILSLGEDLGRRLIRGVVERLAGQAAARDTALV